MTVACGREGGGAAEDLVAGGISWWRKSQTPKFQAPKKIQRLKIYRRGTLGFERFWQFGLLASGILFDTIRPPAAPTCPSTRRLVTNSPRASLCAGQHG